MKYELLLDSETNDWIRKAALGVKPFGAAIEQTIGLLSTAETVDGVPMPVIVDHGRLRWRAINAEPRVRRFQIKIGLAYGRIEKNGADLSERGAERCAATIVVDAFDRGFHQAHVRRDHTVRFSVVSDGAESVITECKCTGGAWLRFQSSFDTRKDHSMPHEIMDYLAAGLTALKAVPVLGPAIAEPVLRLYDAEKRTAFNERIHAKLAEGINLDSKVLAGILEIRDLLARDSGEKVMALDFLAQGIKQSVGLGVIPGSISQSGWPFPFGETVLLQELDWLFLNNIQELRVALTRNGWQVKEHHAPDEVIHQFVKDMRGRRSRLLEVMKQLSEMKPDSQVLRIALLYCAASGNGQTAVSDGDP